jgi:hypothetical protein
MDFSYTMAIDEGIAVHPDDDVLQYLFDGTGDSDTCALDLDDGITISTADPGEYDALDIDGEKTRKAQTLEDFLLLPGADGAAGASLPLFISGLFPSQSTELFELAPHAEEAAAAAEEAVAAAAAEAVAAAAAAAAAEAVAEEAAAAALLPALLPSFRAAENEYSELVSVLAPNGSELAPLGGWEHFLQGSGVSIDITGDGCIGQMTAADVNGNAGCFKTSTQTLRPHPRRGYYSMELQMTSGSGPDGVSHKLKKGYGCGRFDNLKQHIKEKFGMEAREDVSDAALRTMAKSARVLGYVLLVHMLKGNALPPHLQAENAVPIYPTCTQPLFTMDPRARAAQNCRAILQVILKVDAATLDSMEEGKYAWLAVMADKYARAAPVCLVKRKASAALAKRQTSKKRKTVFADDDDDDVVAPLPDVPLPEIGGFMDALMDADNGIEPFAPFALFAPFAPFALEPFAPEDFVPLVFQAETPQSARLVSRFTSEIEYV